MRRWWRKRDAGERLWLAIVAGTLVVIVAAAALGTYEPRYDTWYSVHPEVVPDLAVEELGINRQVYKWTKKYDTGDVIISVTEKRLMWLRMRYLRDVGPLAHGQQVLGLSYLHRDAQQQWYCQIYVWSKRDWKTMRHERRHCAGWIHN